MMRQKMGLLLKAKKALGRGKAWFTILIVLIIAVAFLLNIFVVKMEQRYSLVGDLTGNSAYKVGPETDIILQSLTKDVEIHILADESSFTGDSYLVQANRMMKEYPAKSTKISLNYVDFVSEPTFVSQYPDLSLEQGNILVTCGESTKQIKLSELFNYERNTQGNVVIASSRTEEVITSAILSVTSDTKIKIAVLNGNGVANKSEFIELLDDNGFIISDVNIATGSLDASYDLAILLAPQKDLSETAIESIDTFLYNGGEYGKMLLYSADVTQEPLQLLEGYLKEWGVVVGDGAVFETKEERTYQSQPFYPVVDYSEDTYRDMLIDSSAPMIMPLSRPLETLFEVRDKHHITELLTFVESAGVRPSNATEFKPQDAKQWGPMPALVLATKRINATDGNSTKESSILVSCSTGMFDASCMQNTTFANSEYIVKILNKIFGKDRGVTIIPKSLSGEVLTINTKQKNTIGLILSVILPICILAAGIVIFAVRRHK